MNWYETHPAVVHIRDLHEQAAHEHLAAAARRGRSVGRPLPGDLLDQRPSHRSIIASLILLGLGGVGWGLTAVTGSVTPIAEDRSAWRCAEPARRRVAVAAWRHRRHHPIG